MSSFSHYLSSQVYPKANRDVLLLCLFPSHLLKFVIDRFLGHHDKTNELVMHLQVSNLSESSFLESNFAFNSQRSYSSVQRRLGVVGRVSTLFTWNFETMRRRSGASFQADGKCQCRTLGVVPTILPNCPVGSQKWASQVSEPWSILSMNGLPRR